MGQEVPEAPYPHHRQAFHHAHTTLGAVGHFVHIAMATAPFLIAENIPDPEKKWRAMRLVPAVGAIASEALWALKIAHDRRREQEDHAALDECYRQCR
jgi:hypothetical protein